MGVQIENGVLKKYIQEPNIKDAVVPDGVTEIAQYAFCDCTELKSVTISEGVKKICENAFFGCTSLECIDIRSESVEICEGGFNSTNSLSLVVFPKSYDKIDCNWFGNDGGNSPVGIVISCLSSTPSAFDKKMQDVDDEQRKSFANNLIGFIKANFRINALNDTSFKRAVSYIIEHSEDFSEKQFKEFLDAAGKKGFKKAALSVQAYYDLAIRTYSNPLYEFKGSRFYNIFKCCPKVPKIMSNVKLADGRLVDDIYLVECAIMPYYMQYKSLPEYPYGYADRYEHYCIDSDAEKAASQLDKKSLQECVGEIYHVYGIPLPAFTIPLCRYGTDEQVEAIISGISRWMKDEYSLRRCTTARGAVFISQTKSAMLYFEEWQNGSSFEEYARFHKTTVDDLREQIFADIDLDKDGVHIFNIGGKTVKAELGSDLKISLTDESNGKKVKSLPKKGADPELYAIAAAELKKIKADLKSLVKKRSKLFFEDFLSGRTRDASSYLKNIPANPVLRRIDESIVHSQGDNTFILTENGMVDCFGQPYTVDQHIPIGIAHPMEMNSSTIKAWQEYLIKNEIMQPFEQMWEAVIDPQTITQDRYNGLTMPFVFFKNAVKHGITVHSEKQIYYNGLKNDCIMWIKMKECNADIDYDENDNGYIEDDAKINIRAFNFNEYTRQVNHIVFILDKWTIRQRILEDDPSIGTLLDSFTLPQILNFIDLAAENNCVNVQAVLLNYLNEHYPEYDGFPALDALLLDDF